MLCEIPLPTEAVKCFPRMTETRGKLERDGNKPGFFARSMRLGKRIRITSQRCLRKKTFADGVSRNPQVVIIQPVDNGNKPHPFGHAIVAGIERYPSRITRRMSKARQEKRSKIKPFVKVINYNHLMPTRYTLELEGLKGTITGDTFKEVSQREDAKKTVKKVLEERYTSGKNRWFFTPLSTSPFHPPPRLATPAARLAIRLWTWMLTYPSPGF